MFCGRAVVGDENSVGGEIKTVEEHYKENEEVDLMRAAKGHGVVWVINFK